jgi:hypothetical protein
MSYVNDFIGHSAQELRVAADEIVSGLRSEARSAPRSEPRFMR